LFCGNIAKKYGAPSWTGFQVGIILKPAKLFIVLCDEPAQIGANKIISVFQGTTKSFLPVSKFVGNNTMSFRFCNKKMGKFINTKLLAYSL
jgi:hypothetical protein